jgi:protein-S-isoprenylcysteine O-methyltransferase Ste14
MSLVPEFELGLWNAWIFTLPVIVLQIFGAKILGKRGSGEDWGHTKNEKILNIISSSIVLGPYAYSIFLPLKLGTFSFYAGLLVYLLGMFVEVLAMLSFYTTPVGKPVTKGVYSISRNPMYVGHFCVNIGISIACLSWIFLLVAIVAVILEYSAVTSEERTCLKQYGDAYREYMNRTPRWIGIPKSKKNDNMLPV